MANAVYIALGVAREGEREVLGLWIADNEGVKFWLAVLDQDWSDIAFVSTDSGG